MFPVVMMTLPRLLLATLVSASWAQDIEVLSHICKYGVHSDGVRYGRFYTFYLDLLLGAKHKVLIFLHEDKMSCQSYHSRNLNIFGCGWGELLKVASCNILQGK